MNRIRIYQLTDAIDIPYKFMDYDFAKAHNLDIHDYELVYDCLREDGHLDDIYEEFNLNRPEDFTGHSLSVSDIVLCNDQFYYCNPFGWENCGEFDWHDELEF